MSYPNSPTTSSIAMPDVGVPAGFADLKTAASILNIRSDESYDERFMRLGKELAEQLTTNPMTAEEMNRVSAVLANLARQEKAARTVTIITPVDFRSSPRMRRALHKKLKK